MLIKTAGTGYSMIFEGEWRKFGKPELREISLWLVTYTGKPVKLKGEYDVCVENQGKLQTLPLYVA